MIFTSVDLPAPFSPSSAWISPGCTANETSSFAVTPGKRLVIRESSRRAGIAPFRLAGIDQLTIALRCACRKATAQLFLSLGKQCLHKLGRGQRGDHLRPLVAYPAAADRQCQPAHQ